MKTIKITALALCLNIPMAHAGNDLTERSIICPPSVGVTTYCAWATFLAAHDLYKKWDTLSPQDRKIAPLAVATVGLVTAYSATMTYTFCTSNQ